MIVDEHEHLEDEERGGDAGRALVAFESNGSLFGMAAHDVLAIDEVSAMTAVPMSPPHLIGLLGFRGRPIPLVSIERFAGISERHKTGDAESGRRMLVVSALGMTVAIRCDRVRGIVVVPTETKDVSVVIGRGLETCVREQTDVGSEVMLILDVPKFLEASRLRA